MRLHGGDFLVKDAGWARRSSMPALASAAAPGCPCGRRHGRGYGRLVAPGGPCTDRCRWLHCAVLVGKNGRVGMRCGPGRGHHGVIDTTGYHPPFGVFDVGFGGVEIGRSTGGQRLPDGGLHGAELGAETTSTRPVRTLDSRAREAPRDGGQAVRTAAHRQAGARRTGPRSTAR